MEAHAAGLALAGLSATTTGGAHALLKGGTDRLARRAVIGLTGGTAMLPLLLVLPLPGASVAGWLLLAVVLHAGYQLLLVASYNESDFAAAYPVARGSAPVLAAAGAVALLGDRLHASAWAGIALVSAGCLVRAGGRSLSG